MTLMGCSWCCGNDAKVDARGVVRCPCSAWAPTAEGWNNKPGAKTSEPEKEKPAEFSAIERLGMRVAETERRF